MRWEYEDIRSSVRQRYGYNVVRIIAGCDIRVWAFHNCRFSFLCEICILALGKSKAVDKSAHCILQRVWRGYNSLSIGQSVFRYSWKLSQVLGHANMFNYFLLRIDCSAKSSELSETVGHYDTLTSRVFEPSFVSRLGLILMIELGQIIWYRFTRCFWCKMICFYIKQKSDGCISYPNEMHTLPERRLDSRSAFFGVILTTCKKKSWGGNKTIFDHF